MKKMYRVMLLLAIGILFTTSAWAERLSVNVPMANIRSGPGTSHKVLWKVEKFHPLEVVVKKGDWYQFKDFEGDRGWIHKDLVASYKSVIVNKNKCNVRSGPGTNQKVIFTVERGVPFKVLKKKGDWMYIQHSDGDKGWIYKKLVW